MKKHIKNKWSKSFWTRGYYVTTVGNLTEEAIREYIRKQSDEARKEDSKGACFLAATCRKVSDTTFWVSKQDTPYRWGYQSTTRSGGQ